MSGLHPESEPRKKNPVKSLILRGFIFGRGGPICSRPNNEYCLWKRVKSLQWPDATYIEPGFINLAPHTSAKCRDRNRSEQLI